MTTILIPNEMIVFYLKVTYVNFYDKLTGHKKKVIKIAYKYTNKPLYSRVYLVIC